MSRTVIRLEELGDENGDIRVTFRPEEPADVPDRQRWRTLACDTSQAPFSALAAVAPGDHAPLGGDLVREVGTAVHAALSQHPGVAQALDRAAGAPPGGVHPIHLLTTALDAEAVPWETLHHPLGRFFGLDSRFSIARTVATGSGPLERLFEPPLRFVAILAAADRDARGEWTALRQAILASGLEVQASVFLAEDALEAQLAAEGDAWVEARRVPATKPELIAALQAARPQLLHVYSHGSSDAGGFLEVATPGSVQQLGDPPLYVDARSLAPLQASAWLVTLNACEGATPTLGVHSLAYQLVEGGVPAAIGMREVIDSADANAFSRAFYSAALADLAQSLPPASDLTLDWARFLAPAREALCAHVPGPAAQTASRQKPWTLPVLYRRAEDVRVRRAPKLSPFSLAERARLSAELDVFRRAEAGLHPDNPALVRQALRDQIADLEKQLAGVAVGG